MNLIKRFPYANIYGDERHQTHMGLSNPLGIV